VSATSPWSDSLTRKLSDKDYRFAYLDGQVKSTIAFQIRALREQPDRNWSQSELGARAGKPQSVISRLEDPEYGKASLQTLLEIAQALDVALLVQFVEWGDWLSRMKDLSPQALQKRSFDVTHERNLTV
jgi:transcriptional regulator with XRE-family HTH domain